MGIGYNKNALYPRPITLAKRYLQLHKCRRPYMFDKTCKVFIFNYNLITVARVSIING